jgi:hypothetical protein
MKENIEQLRELCRQYSGVFQIRYYGNSELNSVTWKSRDANVSVKFTNIDFEWCLQATLDKVLEKVN